MTEDELSQGRPNKGDADSETIPAAKPLLFLSYGSQDKNEALELRSMLNESGYRVWMAPDDIRGTRPWAEQILDAIAAAAMMVVLVSTESNRSEHVGREVSLAFDQGKPVLPVRVEDVAMSGILRYHLSIIQNFDAFPPPLKAHKADLVREVASRLGDASLDNGSQVEEARSGTKAILVRKPVLLGIGASALVVMVAALITFAGNGPSPDTTLDGLVTSTRSEATTTAAQTTTTAAQTTTVTAAAFRRFQDDTGRLVVDAPPDWDVQGTPAEVDDSQIGPAITVSSDIAAYRDGWDAPGLFIFASRTLFDQYGTPDAYLNTLSRYQPCDEPVRRPYQDGKYTGVADYYTDCGPVGVGAFKLVAAPTEEPDYLIAVLYKGPSGDDSDLRGAILDTFNYEGEFEWTPSED